jgi:hypothetical protein
MHPAIQSAVAAEHVRDMLGRAAQDGRARQARRARRDGRARAASRARLARQAQLVSGTGGGHPAAVPDAAHAGSREGAAAPARPAA